MLSNLNDMENYQNKFIFRVLRNKILFILVLLFYSYKLIADDYLPKQDTLQQLNNDFQQFPVNNFLNTNFTKYVNTYLFANHANFAINTNFGNFIILQDYESSYLKMEGNPTRDDEHWSFTYEKPISEMFGVIFNQNWHFTSDSRNIGINQLMRLNGLAGLSFIPEQNYKIQFLYGLENNNQLNFKSDGSVYAFSAEANNIFMENFQLNSDFFGNIISLNDGRINKDLNGQIKLFRSFEDSSIFNIDLIYRNLQNNLLGYYSQSGLLPIEIRNENNLNALLNIVYQVNSPFSLNFDLNVISLNVNRNYKKEINDLPYSFFLRNVEQLQFIGNAGFKLNLEKLFLNTKFGFSSRTEKNNLNEQFQGGELDKYQNIESQRDNLSSRVNILTNSIYTFNRSTYISGTYFVQLFRYDTPSQSNFDDRDEFNNILNFKFFDRLSDYLTLLLEFETRQNHLVYIFSERSSLNNWNRVYRFSPQINIKFENFSLNPRMEVLANYTVYDYAKVSSAMNSISFRQVSYSDSLFLKFTEKISFHSTWKIKYSERGVLFWSDFSESPQTGNYEFYGKAIFRRNFAENIWIGSGLNFFKYSQIRLNNNSQIDYNLESISPEISINYVYKNWTMSILGWYEFQKIKSIIRNQITNLSISVNLLF